MVQEFLEKLKFLKLEELITLKLLVSTSLLKESFLIFLLKYSTEICKEAVLRFALSQANSRKKLNLF